MSFQNKFYYLVIKLLLSILEEVRHRNDDWCFNDAERNESKRLSEEFLSELENKEKMAKF